MPYHLELGSEGHSFHGKAIVVNSQTGEHKSSHPIPLENAKAQMRVLEEAHKKENAPEPAPKKKFVFKKKPALALMKSKHEAQKEEIPEREEEAPKEVKAKAEKKTTYPLVSREEYKHHLKLLRSVFAGKKVLVKDRPLQAELADIFLNTGRVGGHLVQISQAFINGLASIYNDTIRRKERFSDPPTKLEWIDWFDASKTDQASGINYARSDNYRYGGLEKYFNIYPNATGKAHEFHNKEYGYFYGFRE